MLAEQPIIDVSTPKMEDGMAKAKVMTPEVPAEHHFKNENLVTMGYPTDTNYDTLVFYNRVIDELGGYEEMMKNLSIAEAQHIRDRFGTDTAYSRKTDEIDVYQSNDYAAYEQSLDVSSSM